MVIELKPAIWIDYTICQPKQCKYECLSSCPVNRRQPDQPALLREDGKPVIDQINCNDCKRCVTSCPLNAIRDDRLQNSSNEKPTIATRVDLQDWTKKPYVKDKSWYTKFDEAQTVFARVLNDPDFVCYNEGVYHNQDKIFAKDQLGYSRVEGNLAAAAWNIYDTFDGAFSWKNAAISSDLKFDADLEMPSKSKYEVKDPQAMSKAIKQAAKTFGAALIGITENKPDWVYSHNRKGEKIDIPPHINNVIVMAVEMDLRALQTSPAYPSAIATGNGYSRMAFLQACMAAFIRNLGYDAIPAGNGTGLSIPLAVDAGLGEFGRHGLLITEKYGSNVRICKVYTDMPLQYDTPIKFGVLDFCKSCMRCAQTCPSQSISYDRDPCWEGETKSNNPGILKWYVNVETCYQFWVKNGNDCSNCIVSCPFTKDLHWTHKIPRFFIKHFPVFNRLWVKLDHWMGYGRQRDPEKFWDENRKFIQTR